jgi:hypothetical protein
MAESGDESTFQGRYVANEHTVGPWGPDMQHAGPPTALLLRAVQQLSGAPADALPARLTAEVFRPVPVGEVLIRARMVRPGRRVAWAAAQLAVASEPDRAVMRCHVWLVRRTPDPLDLPMTATPPPPGPGRPQQAPGSWGGGYLESVSWELTHGSFAEPGPAGTWTTLLVDLVDHEPTSGVQHAAIVADAGSGISAVADPSRLLFVNTELTIHLHREPEGPSVSMDAETTLDRHGVGYVHTKLGDTAGGVGAAAQTLFVEPR